MLGQYRDPVARLAEPVARLLSGSRIRPNQLSCLGLGVSAIAAVAFATDHGRWGGLLLALAGALDILDGGPSDRPHLARDPPGPPIRPPAPGSRDVVAVTAPEASPTPPALAAEHLGLTYPGPRGRPAVAILHDVSVAVPRGAALTVVGPSGSGKSSLLRCFNRLEEPTTGSVRFHGRDVRSLDPLTLRRRVALVAQTPVLFEGSVRDNLRTHPPDAEVDLSARRLRADPEVLLLDEPTSALDPPNAARVVETVSALRAARSLTVVAVTHQPELVRQLSGRLLYLVRGAVQADEAVEAMAGDPGDSRLRAFLAGRPGVAGEVAAS